MEDTILLDVFNTVVINPLRRPAPELHRQDDSLHVLQVAVSVGGMDYTLFIYVLDDGTRLFRDPFTYDSIDNDDNTPFLTKLQFAFKLKGKSENTSAFLAGRIFDMTVDKAFSEYLGTRTDRSAQSYSTSSTSDQFDLF